MYPELTTRQTRLFWAKVAPPDAGGCRDWLGSRNRTGYGQAWIRRRAYLAHRLAFLLAGGVLGDETPLVCHRCNRSICCEPGHLYADDHAGNMRYKREQARGAVGDRNGTRLHPERVARGERQGLSRLTAEQVQAIRGVRARGATFTSIAQRLGVARSTVARAIKGETWAHVT
ncbi:MAG TPA: helix-turn-helix domain-containing protein [Marmoricola sp.]|jgi:predicted DNA-binding protein (UPF0251 family)